MTKNHTSAPPISVLLNAMVMTEEPFGYAMLIRSYLDALADAMLAGKISDIIIYVVCQRRALSQVDPAWKLRNYSSFRFIVVPDIRNVLLRSIFEQIGLNFLAIMHRCEVIHMPATLGLIFSLRPQLLFFHASTTFKLERKMHGRSRLSTWLQNFVIRQSARSADLLAISTNTTAEELLTYLGTQRPYYILGDGVRTFTEGRSPNRFEAALGGARFALYVSSFYELKNQRLLISAFASNCTPKGLYLVSVGGRANSEYYESCNSLALSSGNIILPEDVDDAELSWLYEHCDVYVNPSFFEGFSLTPLEALSFGRPIVLSNIPVHKEVYGDGFEYFDPNNIESLESALQTAVTDSYKSRCKFLGRPLLEKYSWDTFALKNVALYREIVSGAPAHPA
jgi:glycosyltransferase involved in cell wall biosynthesis